MTQAEPPTQSRLFRWWGQFVLRHRRLFAAATVALTVCALWATVDRRRGDNSIARLIPRGAPSAQVLERTRDACGQNDLFIVVASGDVFSEEFLGRLRGLHEALADLNPPLASLGERLADRRVQRGVDTAVAEEDDGSVTGSLIGFAAVAAVTAKKKQRSSTKEQEERTSSV